MRIHLIAVGGAAMHNLALALASKDHVVSGSDDEIYDPAAGRLSRAGLAPPALGWFPEKITSALDFIILGMHARVDNPELLAAQKIGLKIYSYPEFIYEHAKNKLRIVVAGSHGKTTTTSMIMHVFKKLQIDFDYLVGAQLEGFDNMIRLSNAPVMVIEGDEYLSSPIDRRPKILHYQPHIAVVTGIAWDHVNVFPTFAGYVRQFELFIATIQPFPPNDFLKSSIKKSESKGRLIYYESDPVLNALASESQNCYLIPYKPFEGKIINGKTHLIVEGDKTVLLEIFGAHNLANLQAAFLVCHEIGISDNEFFNSVQTFGGASKRLQILYQTGHSIAFLDFAHAPSKVKATVEAVKTQFPDRRLVACLEFHTFSSLNKSFLSEYKHTMASADIALAYYSPHTLEMKKMEPISIEEIRIALDHPRLHIFTDNRLLVEYLKMLTFEQMSLLWMTSGSFGGLDIKQIAQSLLAQS